MLKIQNILTVISLHLSSERTNILFEFLCLLRLILFTTVYKLATYLHFVA